MRLPGSFLACATLLLTVLACAGTATPEGTNSAIAPSPMLTPTENVAVADDISVTLAKLQADYEKRKREAMKAFPKKETDEVRGLTFFHPKNAPKYINSKESIYAYLSKESNKPETVFIEFNYVGDNWVFFQSVKIRSGDFIQEISTITIKDHGGGRVGEKASLLLVNDEDVQIPGRSISMAVARHLFDDGKVIVRFQGREFYDDHEMQSWEKSAIRAALIIAEKPPTMDDAKRVLTSPVPPPSVAQ